MNRRMIVLFCFLWSVGCIGAMCLCVGCRQGVEHNAVQETQIVFTAQELSKVSLPYMIPGTSLLLRGIYPYDGAFWEDGSGREVIGVTALLLENIGEYGIDRARVIVSQGKDLLKFNVSKIPPGAEIVVLEQGRAPFTTDVVHFCYGTQYLQLEGWDLSAVAFNDTGMGTLSLTNTTDAPLRNLCLFYKDYLQGMYIGGVANSYTVEEILPGEAISISPQRYAAGGSKILCILTE